MNEIGSRTESSRWPWLLAGGCVVVVLITVLAPRPDFSSPSASAAHGGAATPPTGSSPTDRPSRAPRQFAAGSPARTSEEIVARKPTQFSKNRRGLVHAMAKHFKLTVPAEFERFFDAGEAGRYEEMEAIYKSLLKARANGTDPR